MAAYSDIGTRFVEKVKKGREHVSGNIIVAVYKADVFASGHLESRISRVGRPAALLVNDPDSRIKRRIVIADLVAAVRRTVVDQNDLEIRICLMNKAEDAYVKKRLHSEYRNNDTDHG